MSIFDGPKHLALKIVDKVSPSCGETLRRVAHLPRTNEALIQRLDKVEGELHELRGVLGTLNRDLDESRRLNLRAAELMDVAFSQLLR